MKELPFGDDMCIHKCISVCFMFASMSLGHYMDDSLVSLRTQMVWICVAFSITSWENHNYALCFKSFVFSLQFYAVVLNPTGE